MADEYAQTVKDEWVSFPGGELEGKRPKALCPDCREALKRDALACGVSSQSGQSRPPGRSRPLCFQCYRADIERQKALRAAGHLETASDERFQFVLPLEPVDKPRLEMLRADRAAARATERVGVGRFIDRRRRAQIAARHALQSIVAGLRMRKVEAAERERAVFAATHIAELQLPESWLPFVVSR